VPWKEGKSMPTARSALNVIFLNGTLYAIGGQDASKILNTNEAKAPMLTDLSDVNIGIKSMTNHHQLN